MATMKSSAPPKGSTRIRSITRKRPITLKDRRNYPRSYFKLPVSYSRKENKDHYGGIIGNASEGGILVYLPEKLNTGEVLKIEILFAKGWELKTVRGTAKIVWSDLAVRKSRKIHRYGLQFQVVNKNNLQKLKILLKEGERKSKPLPSSEEGPKGTRRKTGR